MGLVGGAAMVLANAFPLAADGSFQFPTLPGLTLEYTLRPTFNTIVQTAVDRSTTRLSFDPYPLWEYDLQFGYISDDPQFSVVSPSNPLNYTQLEQIMGLYLACGGQLTAFLMDISQITKKAKDNTAQAVPIGVGDGTNASFQLVRPIGGFLDFIDNPVPSTVSVMVTPVGGPTSGAPIETLANGVVTLANVPPARAVVTASFSFLQRLRFVSDAEEFDGMLYLLHNHGALKLRQERNQT